MTDLRCPHCGQVHPGANEVTLHDGTKAGSYSEAWRLECEARAVLAMPTKRQRQEYIFGKLNTLGEFRGGIEQVRGKASADQLADMVRRLFYARRAANDA